jgi:hypothetical protein
LPQAASSQYKLILNGLAITGERKTPGIWIRHMAGITTGTMWSPIL